MQPFEAHRLHASGAARHAGADRLARTFDLHLRGASPALASALAADRQAAAPGAAATVIAAVLETADGVRGGGVAAFDALRQRGRAMPRTDAVIGHALMAALRDLLGAGFDEATQEAWANGYIGLVETVMAARRNTMDLVA